VTMTDSTVDNNIASYDLGVLESDGGGIYSQGSVTLTRSTVSNNRALGNGGGIYAVGGVTLAESTVSGNRAIDNNSEYVYVRGGGIFSSGAVVIQRSTIANNIGEGVATAGALTIEGSILANNNGGDIYRGNLAAAFTVNYSLIESPGGSISGTGNILNVDPQLGPLAANGGPTKTHALPVGSPAINAGNPAFTSPPNFDQRGIGFARVVGGRVDMGAYENQTAAPVVSADFDGDGDIDGRDFLMWQRGFGITAPNAVKADGDADNDTDVDGVDLGVWQEQYGENEELSAVSGSDPEGATPGLVNEVSFFIAAPANRSVRGYLGIENDVDTLYAEEADLAFEELATTSTSVRSFGEMVTRRGVAKRVVLESAGSAFE
jgi:predicted outer membrane repeat protein